MLTKSRGLLLLILLLALALRVFHLDTQSIWYDEGLSIQLAAQNPAQTIALSATTDHPPLHTLLLGMWMRIAGESDFVVRYLSVFCGVLAVALTYALGKRYSERAGLIAAGLMAIAPLAIYYSQETRGYMLLTTLILLATLAALRLLGGDRRKRIWLAYIASMALALYTHYFAAFAWVAINVGWLVIWLINPHTSSLSARERVNADTRSSPGREQGEGRLRLFVIWIIAQLIILVCFLPWIPNALAQAGSNATYFPGRVTWDTVFADTWRAFTVGEKETASFMTWLWLSFRLPAEDPLALRTLDVARVGWVWLVLLGLGSVVAFIQWARARSAEYARRRISTVIILWFLLIVPLLLMSGLAWFKPKFAPRYLLPSLPAFIALASIGLTLLIAGLKTRYRVGAALGLILALGLPLASLGATARLYADPELARPDVRSVVHYIENAEQPTDAILLVGGHQAPAFDHYYRGKATVIPLPPDLLPAAQSPLDARALGQLKSIVQEHPRIWLVQWQSAISDPTNIIENTLVATSQRINVGENFHDMSLLWFDVTGAQIPDAPQHTLDATFTEPIRAVGYNVDNVRIPIDTALRFGLYLKAEGPITGNYQVFAHLVSSDGNPIAQADHIAGADSYPTSLWRPGSLLYNRFEISVPPGTPPGEYQVLIGLYDQRGRLLLADGRDHIDLFTVTLTP